MAKKNWSQVPDGRLTPGQTGRLTVGRKLTSTSTLTSISEITVQQIWRLIRKTNVPSCLYFKTRKWSCNEQALGHGSRQVREPRMNLLTKANSSLSDVSIVLHSVDLWCVTPYNFVDAYKCLRGIYCLYPQINRCSLVPSGKFPQYHGSDLPSRHMQKDSDLSWYCMYFCNMYLNVHLCLKTN
jgi:hypothetical protein